jgi:hypothetical protein
LQIIHFSLAQTNFPQFRIITPIAYGMSQTTPLTSYESHNKRGTSVIFHFFSSNQKLHSLSFPFCISIKRHQLVFGEKTRKHEMANKNKQNQQNRKHKICKILRNKRNETQTSPAKRLHQREDVHGAALSFSNHFALLSLVSALKTRINYLYRWIQGRLDQQQ